MATYMVAIRTSISQQVYFVTREVKCICSIKVIRREKGKLNRFSFQTIINLLLELHNVKRSILVYEQQLFYILEVVECL